MNKPALAARRFRVRTIHTDDHHAYLLTAANSAAAAIAYLEVRPSRAGGDDVARILVHDLETGHEHCFRIDLGSGQAPADEPISLQAVDP